MYRLSLVGFTPRGMTPRVGGGMTPGMTPGSTMRDNLNINREEAFLDDQENMRQNQLEMKSQLISGLQGLPLPSNDFEIVVPEVCKFSLSCCIETEICPVEMKDGG